CAAPPRRYSYPWTRDPPLSSGSERAQLGRDGDKGKILLDERDRPPAMDHKDDGARHPDRAGLLEENAAIAIGIDAERRRAMKEDGAGDDAERQRRSDDLGCRNEEKDRSDQLGRAGADPHHLLIAVKAEPIGQRREKIDAARMPEKFVLQIPDVNIGDQDRE